MTAEIKTGKKPIAKILPQMWFGRTPHLIRGQHSSGTFHKVDISHMDKELVQWENDDKHQLALRKMAALIARLRSIVIERRDQVAIVIFRREGQEKLKVFERRPKRLPLPDDVIAGFWRGKQ